MSSRHGAPGRWTVVAHARERGFRRLLPRTTQEGRGLYLSAGFAALEHLAIDLA